MTAGAALALVAIVALVAGVMWLALWLGSRVTIGDEDEETERMANLFMAEAMGEADWLANKTGYPAAATRQLAIVALNRAAIKLGNRAL